jgi:phosphonopyruvate decarboxylase
MGQITGKLLDVLQIPWSFFPGSKDEIDVILDRGENEMVESSLPFALIMKKGDVAKDDLKPIPSNVAQINKNLLEGEFNCEPGKWMSRMEAIKIIQNEIAREYAFVATTGKISRELFTLGDHENQLYVVGSMGCAAGIGFGIQYLRPKQSVIVLDGDGAVLMKMGTMATIGHYQPKRFIHVIFDNEAYESTGGQSSVSSTVDFCKIAQACGYSKCFRVDTQNDLKNCVKLAKSVLGPVLIHVKVINNSFSGLVRPTVKPCQVKERFMKFLEKEGSNV